MSTLQTFLKMTVQSIIKSGWNAYIEIYKFKMIN